MTSRNEITGDELKSKTNNDLYRDGWDRIFGKKKEEKKEIRTLADYIHQVEKSDRRDEQE